ncbi:MAG: hypothetical protein HY812_22040 [Planctomycetes bacterium]|nr:hypothetical protein [Planctomycetota bacterium]
MKQSGGSPASLERAVQPGLHAVTLARAGQQELFLTAVPLPEEGADAVLARAGRFLEERGARIVALDAFGLAVPGEALARHLGPVAWPVTRMRLEGGGDAAPGGVHVQAVIGCRVEPVFLAGRAVGSLWSDERARWCRLGGLSCPRAASPAREARTHLLLMDAILAGAGLDFGDVARTWFFLDSIEAWYVEFNKTRQTFLAQRKLLRRALPASTGVGGSNPEGTALSSGLLAVQGRETDGVRKSDVPSPLQCQAKDYGSFFSRAIELSFPDHRRLLVSGTASIDEHGRPAHAGDAPAQIERTMAVVQAILESRGMGLRDVTRAVAYFRNGQDAGAFASLLARAGLPDLPVILTRGEICFADLLFEIEVDAIACA